jgi:hypothetical protein
VRSQARRSRTAVLRALAHLWSFSR